MTEDKLSAAMLILTKNGVIGSLADELKTLFSDPVELYVELIAELYLKIAERLRVFNEAHPESESDAPEALAEEEAILTQLDIIWQAADENATAEIRRRVAELFAPRKDNLVDR